MTLRENIKRAALQERARIDGESLRRVHQLTGQKLYIGKELLLLAELWDKNDWKRSERPVCEDRSAEYQKCFLVAYIEA
jgi:hypothetical protein